MPESKIITISEDALRKPLSMESIQRIQALDERPVDYSDAPELPDAWFEAARAERENRRAKKAVSIRLDPDIIEYFKAEGDHYQSRINAVLRVYVNAMHTAS